MRRPTVRDRDGNRYELLKESDESSLVRDPETGDRQYLPNDALEPVADESALAGTLDALPEETVALVTGVHDETALALLLELDAEGPTAVRTLLSIDAFCESDLHGLLADLEAGGLVAQTRLAGERGYETTGRASRALSHLRDR